MKDAAAAAKATTPSPAPKADPPPLPLAEAQEKAQSFRRRKLSYDTMDPNAITTDGKVDEPDATGSTAEAGSESFAAVKIAIEGESAIVSIDTSPTARCRPRSSTRRSPREAAHSPAERRLRAHTIPPACHLLVCARLRCKLSGALPARGAPPAPFL